jgi:DNA-binding beta-propeller fold protein YncE
LAGQGAGLLYGTYDAPDNLLLLPDGYNNVDVLNGPTFHLEGFLPVGGWGPVTTYNHLGYIGFFPPSTPSFSGHIIQFDPVSQAVTRTITVPVDPGDNTGDFVQIQIVGETLFAPYNFSFTAPDGVDRNAVDDGMGSAMAVVDTSTFTRIALYSLPGFLEGFAVPSGTSTGYLSVSKENGDFGAELIKLDLSTGATIATVGMQAAGLLLVSPDGSTLYIYNSAELVAIDVPTLAVKISVPLNCTGLAITPDGNYLYCATTSAVDILSASTLGVLGTIPSASPALEVGSPIVIAK